MNRTEKEKLFEWPSQSENLSLMGKVAKAKERWQEHCKDQWVKNSENRFERLINLYKELHI